MGEADAGVSCCAFDDGAAWFEQACFFGVFDDEEGGAILDGAAGVLKFSFAEDITARFFGELLEADERSLADGCVESAHGSPVVIGIVAYHQ